MIKITQASKEKVLSSIRAGRIDVAEISQPNFIDGIIEKMYEIGVVSELCHVIEDKRKPNVTIHSRTGNNSEKAKSYPKISETETGLPTHNRERALISLIPFFRHVSM